MSTEPRTPTAPTQGGGQRTSGSGTVRAALARASVPAAGPRGQRGRFAEAAPVLVDAFAAGCSTRDAASAAGVGERTVKRWLTDGRRDPAGAFGSFARAVEDARTRAVEAGPALDAHELAVLVSEQARKGNTAAMRLRWQMLQAEREAAEPDVPADPFAVFDRIGTSREPGRA